MKFFKAIGLSILLCSILTNNVFSQTDTEFWFVVPEVTIDHQFPGGQPASFRFSTGLLPATVTISMPANQYDPITNPGGFPDIVFDMAANSFRIEDVTCWIMTPCNPAGGTSVDINKLENKPLTPSGINKFGIHITSTNPITVYYEISRQSNKEIWALKGKNALGTDFYTPFQTHGANQNVINDTPSAIDVVATEDNTVVTFQLPAGISASYGKPMSIVPAGGTLTRTLMAGETFSLFPLNKQRTTATRLRGTRVTSTRPIAITIKDDSFVHIVGGCYDLAGDQLVPTNIIGKEYAIIRSDLNECDHIYILGTQNATNVTIYNTAGAVIATPTVDAGQQLYYTLPTGQTFYRVMTDKPVYVWHIGGFGCEQGGAILPPIDICTGTTQVAFARTSTETFYIIMMVRKGAEDGFTFNGAVRNDLFPPASFVSYAGFNWSVARFGPFTTAQIPAGVSNFMNNSKDVFHLGIVNGGAGSGCYYGYFSDYNELKLNAIVGGSNTSETNLCYGESTFLHASGGLNYSWSPIIFLDNPNSPHPIVVSPTTTTKYTVTVLGACNLTSTADVTVNVSEPLIPSFIADTLSGCGNLTVNFTNTSVGNVRRLYWYVKNEGDPDPGTLVKTANLEINPTDNGLVYNFVNSGIEPQNFVVNLLVDAESCQKVVSKSITVYPLIDINPEVFAFSNLNGCNPLTVNLRANPIGNYGDATFLWNFGDGGTSADQNPTHVYNNLTSAPTTFTANVTLTDQWHYCSVTKPVNVTVQPYIKANFVVDVVEGCSPLNNISIINDSKGAITAFEWDKDGDGTYESSGGGDWLFSHTNDNIPANTPDVVTLSLRVSNSGGCTDVATRTITINPRATANITPFVLGDPACAPLEVYFNATTTNANIYHWMIDGTAVDNVTSTSYIFDNFSSTPITKSVTFTADNQWGCAASATPENITVNPFVQAVLAIDDREGCSPHIAVMTNASSPGSLIFEWDILNDGSIDFNTKNIGPQAYTYPESMNNSFATYNIPVRLTARNRAGCTDVAIQTITVNPQATASFVCDLNGNTNACSPVDVNFNGTYTNAEFYQWQFGDLGASAELNPFFQLDNTSSMVKAVQVDLIASNRFECNAPVVSQSINVQPFIKANFAIDKVEGCSPFIANIINNSRGPISHFSWDKDGDGNFETHDGAIEWTFFQENTNSTPKTIDLGLVVYNEGGCSSAVNRIITVNPNPIVNLGDDKVICKGEYTVLNAENSGSFFEWSTGATTQTISEKNAGTYSVIVTNEYDCASTDEINILVNEVATITKQPVSIRKCLGDIATFSITAIGNNINYQWQKDGVNLPSATSSTFTINNVNKSDEGTYTCIVSNECNEALSELASLNVEQEPTIIFLSPSESIELGNSLSLNVNATGDNLIFQWNKDGIPLTDNTDIQGSSTNTLLITAVKLSDSGNYTCTITNDCNTITSNLIAIDVYEIPVVNLGEDKEICQGESLILDAKNEGATYLWSNGETSQTILVSSSGNYSVIVTNSKGYQSSDDFTLTVNNLPTVILGDNKTICQGRSVTLDASNDGASYLWNNGATTKTITVFEQGNYSVTVTNSKGCSNTDEIQLTVNPLPVVNLGSDKTLCEGQSLTLDANNDGATYLWSNGATSKTIVVSEQDTYSVTVTDNNNCSNSDQIQVTVYPLPSINIGDDTQYASTPLTLDPGPNFLSYQWQDGSTNRTYTVNETGLYSVTVTDINGCVGSDNVYVIWEQIQDIIVSKLLSPVTGCTNDQKQQVIVELQNISKNTYLAGDSVFVYYSLNSKMPIIEEVLFDSDFTPNKTITYAFNKEESFDNGLSQINIKTILHGDHSLQNTYYVNISPSPYLNFEFDTIHSSLPYELTAETNNVSYLWSNGSTGSSITINLFGEYWLRVTNNYGCSASDTVIITWPLSSEIISDIDATIKLFPNPVKDELNVWIESDKSETYTLELINPQGLIVHKQQTVSSDKITDVIQVEKLTPGMYILRVSSNKGSGVFKVIVTRN